MKKLGPIHPRKRAMVLFFDSLETTLEGPELVRRAPRELKGKTLGCHCVGRYPVCHAEVWARLADGEELAAIRADVLKRIGIVEAPHA